MNHLGLLSLNIPWHRKNILCLPKDEVPLQGTGSPKSQKLKKKFIPQGCCVTPRCQLLVSGCSATCGPSASEEHGYAEVWSRHILAKHCYYLRISSTNVMTPFDFILCNGSLGRDFHNPWPYILQLDSIWSPVSLSLVHINLEIPYLSLELDLLLLVSRGEYIIKIRKLKYHCAALPKACAHLVMFLVKFAKACISTAKRVFPHLPSIPPPLMQCRIEWLWAFWDLAKKLNWRYI